jgi:hypothetical protein
MGADLTGMVWYHERDSHILTTKHPTEQAGLIHIVSNLYSIGDRPPLWSSGQSSWLQIRRPGFDSRHYQKKKVVGQERGPLSLLSTTEELLDRKVAAPV